jgi:hypothetical protein
MKDFINLALFNRWRAGKELCAELPSGAEDLRKWIGVYPPQQFEHRFIIWIEAYKKDGIKEHPNDIDMYIVACEKYWTDTEEELIQKLVGLGIDLKLLTYPWRCDYLR